MGTDFIVGGPMGHGSSICKFLMSRRDQRTREYTKTILNAVDCETGILCKDLVKYLVPNKVPNESTVYNILNGLQKAGIVTKTQIAHSGRGATPTSYKANFPIHNAYFMSWESLAEFYIRTNWGD